MPNPDGRLPGEAADQWVAGSRPALWQGRAAQASVPGTTQAARPDGAEEASRYDGQADGSGTIVGVVVAPRPPAGRPGTGSSGTGGPGTSVGGPAGGGAPAAGGGNANGGGSGTGGHRGAGGGSGTGEGSGPNGRQSRWERARDLPVISGHQGALDGIRALAAFAVLVTHVAGQTAFSVRGEAASWAAARGDVGVPIFFTLSGLLLFRPWVRAMLEGRPWPKVRSYLWRRALRILPAYWAVVLIALPTLSPKHITSAWTWVQHLLLLQVYDPAPWWRGTGAPGLGQMWSLCTEMAFYLVLPVIALVLAKLACRGGAGVEKRARRLLIGLVVTGMCSFGFIVFEFLPQPKFWLEETLPQSLVWFACGMILSVLSVWARVETNPEGPVNRFCRTVAASGGTCWLLAGLVFAIACTPVAGPAGFAVSTVWDTETKTALYAIIGMVLVAPAALQPARETRMSRVLGNRVMRFLGKISYGVYLWQFLLIIGFFNLVHLKDGFHQNYSGVDVAGLLIMIGAGTAVAAAASYFVIEGPAQRLYRLVPQTAPRHAAKHRKASRAWSPPPP